MQSSRRENGAADLHRVCRTWCVANRMRVPVPGFQEAEDNLAALSIMGKETQVQEQAVGAAQQVVTIISNQYQAGIVGYPNVGVRGSEMTIVILLCVGVKKSQPKDIQLAQKYWAVRRHHGE